MNLHEELLHTTLRIEVLDDAGNAMGTGTGFLVSVPVGDNAEKIVLVSNKHVLMASDKIAITFTLMRNDAPQYGQTVRIPLTKVGRNVVAHPSNPIDVAALVCTGLFNMMPDQLYFKAIPYHLFADFTEEELTVAEEVLFIGYPNDRFDRTNNLPLVRSGLIASDPKKDYNGLPQFVIDAQVFPGSSGSPVVVNLTREAMKIGIYRIVPVQNIKLLGIVAQTMVRNNILQSVDVASKHYTQEVLGLGIVIKATAIKEVVDLAITQS